jgi:hypothetical protein
MGYSLQQQIPSDQIGIFDHRGSRKARPGSG